MKKNNHILWSHIESRLNSSLPQWQEHIENFGQVAAIEKRIAGKTWNDDEVFEGLLMAVLSSGIDWSKIEKIRTELEEVFFGFSLEEYAALPETKIADYIVTDRVFQNLFFRHGCGSSSLTNRFWRVHFQNVAYTRHEVNNKTLLLQFSPTR